MIQNHVSHSASRSDSAQLFLELTKVNSEYVWSPNTTILALLFTVNGPERSVPHFI